MEGSPPSKPKISNDSNQSIQIIQITLSIHYFVSIQVNKYDSLPQAQTTQQHKNIHKAIVF